MAFSLFPAFFDCPTRLKLAHQEKDEHIELFLRRHWSTNVSWILIVLLVSFIPLLSSNLRTIISGLSLIYIPTNIWVALIIIWYLSILAYTIEKFLHWYFNIYIITNKHLIDIDFHNLQSRDITEVRLEDVESAKSAIKGVIGPLFNFGDVFIETAAEKQDIEFLSVPRPDFVADRIGDLQGGSEGCQDAG